MDPLTLTTIASLGISAAKTGFGIFQASRQRDEERAAVREQVRRMQLENAQVLGQTTALGASDEFGLSGSLPAYIGAMASEMSREVGWAKRAGMRSANLNFAAGIFGGVADLGGSVIRAGDANKWWMKGA